jgi:NTP pyrophosphatase (non-canonical NTP hydrolase)
MLCVTELAEACEGHRRSRMDDHLPHRSMFEVELADCLIRVMDLATGLGLDLAGAWRDKVKYNTTRPDHSLAERAKPGGKKY